jgi:hypothetical protein
MSDTERQLLARLEAIEQTEARLKRQSTINLAGLAALVGLAAGLFFFAARRGMPGAVSDVVESREYRLRDKDGQVRGAWGFADDGAMRFVLQNPGDQRAVRLNLLPDGSAGITLTDSAGAARVILGFLEDGTSSLVFADGVGTARSVYSVTPGGATSLIFADKGGVTRAVMGVDARGHTLMSGDAMVQPPEAEADSAALDTTTAAASRPRGR